MSQPTAGRRSTWRKLIIVVAVLAVAGGGYAAGHYIPSVGSPHLISLVVTSTALPDGARLSEADLHVVTVVESAAPPGALGPAGAAASIGLVTDRPVPAGTFLSRSILVPGGASPRPGQAQVGLALKPGQFPTLGLVAGYRVLVLLLPQNAQGTPQSPVPFGSATVWAVNGPDSTGAVSVTVVVPAVLARTLVGYASRGQVALVTTYGSVRAVNPSPAPTHSLGPRNRHHKRK